MLGRLAVLVLFLGLLAMASPAFAGDPGGPEETSYDKYTPELRKPEVLEKKVIQKQERKETLASIPAAPVDAAKNAIEHFLIWVEKNHIDAKFRHVFGQFARRGIVLKQQFNEDSPRIGHGLNVGLEKLFLLEEKHPDFKANAWLSWTTTPYHEYGVQATQSHFLGSPFYVSGLFKYEERQEDQFFGLGPKSSAGDQTNYHEDMIQLITRLGLPVTKTLNAEGIFMYRDVEISQGRDKGSGPFDEIQRRLALPGAQGANLVNVGVQLFNDTRDSKIDPEKGGFESFLFSYGTSTEDSAFSYLKYRAEAARYFPLWSMSRVLAARAYLEATDPDTEKRRIPFFDLARMGGYGFQPRLSQTNRGYQFNRFFGEHEVLFNLEYRWGIWNYKDLSADAVAFWDTGKVFRDFGDWRLDDYRNSYGGGVRFKAAGYTVLNIEGAHSADGTRWYVKSQTPF